MEGSKGIAIAALEAIFKHEHERFRAMCAPDCTYINMGDFPASGRRTWEQWLESHIAAGKALPHLTINIGALTAEHDRVAVEAESWANSPDGGRELHQQYHFLFKISEGRIRVFKEYFDTLHAARTIRDELIGAGAPKTRESILDPVVHSFSRDIRSMYPSTGRTEQASDDPEQLDAAGAE